jgi:hypothetical protein
VNKGQVLEADAQSAEVVKQGDGALYDPTGFAQTAAVRLAPPCDFSCNAGGMSRAEVFVVVVAPVALNELRFP